MSSVSDGARVAVIIVNYRTPDLTMKCLAALRRERANVPSLTALVVDGGSGDGSAEKLATGLSEAAEYRDWVSLLSLTINGGYGWANNQGILTLARQEPAPDFFYVLNPDTEVCDGAVSNLVTELIDKPRCGAAGSLLLNSNHEQTASAFRFPSIGRELAGAAHSKIIGSVLGIEPIVVRPETSSDVDWVTGASVMFRARALRDSGLFDDGFFLYFEEVELMHRLRAHGWSISHVPASKVVHIEGAATGVGSGALDRPFPPYWYESRRRYFELTGGVLRLAGANLSSVAGQAIAGLKRLGGRPVQSKSLRLPDFLKLAFLPSGNKSRPSYPRLGDEPGTPPAWMGRN